jgi:hypothetical protein
MDSILVHRVLEIGSISHETLLSPTFQAFCPVLRPMRVNRLQKSKIFPLVRGQPGVNSQNIGFFGFKSAIFA